MLFMGKGDGGTTTLFGCDQKMSKSSAIAEALGSVDEINSLHGVLKMKGGSVPAIFGLSYHALLSDVQQDLFVVQAQLAGAAMEVDTARVKKLEGWTNAIEKELPPITSFFVSGGTELGALADLARTVARRAERRVVQVVEESATQTGQTECPPMLAYMNRLSSVLYALARLANHRAGVAEEKPHY
jgi:cob(I)alamin adenosyltransferase